MTRLPNPFLGITTTVTTTTTTVELAPQGVKAGFNGTLVAVVIDESGSMSPHVKATLDGFNEYINGQRKAEGSCQVKVNKFEGGNVVDLWGFRDLAKVPTITEEHYRPSGGTNLLDAVGQTITEIDTHLQKFEEKDRPAVLVLIMTDGQENQSRKYSKEAIASMVKDREALDWGFTFMGANIDAFAVGASFGMRAANTMNYSTHATADTFAAAAASTVRYRSAKMAGFSTEAIYSTDMFTADERTKASGDK